VDRRNVDRRSNDVVSCCITILHLKLSNNVITYLLRVSYHNSSIETCYNDVIEILSMTSVASDPNCYNCWRLFVLVITSSVCLYSASPPAGEQRATNCTFCTAGLTDVRHATAAPLRDHSSYCLQSVRPKSSAAVVRAIKTTTALTHTHTHTHIQRMRRALQELLLSSSLKFDKV